MFVWYCTAPPLCSSPLCSSALKLTWYYHYINQAFGGYITLWDILSVCLCHSIVAVCLLMVFLLWVLSDGSHTSMLSSTSTVRDSLPSIYSASSTATLTNSPSFFGKFSSWTSFSLFNTPIPTGALGLRATEACKKFWWIHIEIDDLIFMSQTCCPSISTQS